MEDEFKIPRRSWMPIWIGLGALSVIVLATAAWFFWPGPGPAQALFGSQKWVASDANLGKVDLMQVHQKLLPDWGIASANREVEGFAEAEKTRYESVRTAIAADKNLTDMFEEIRARAEFPIENSDDLMGLLDDWSEYLDGHGAPYLLQGNVVTTRSSSFFYIKTYEVQRNVWLKVGDERIRAREVNRLDQTNVMEQYLGATAPGQADATVVLDRLGEFAISTVWLLLARQDLSSLETMVLAEIKSNLEPKYFEILSEYAPERLLMQGALDSIAERRECSNFSIRSIPHSGLDQRDRDGLQALARRVKHSRCPDITRDEAAILTDTSESFADEPELGAAIRALVALLGANVAVHEARHVADDRAVDGLREPMECNGCPRMSVMAIAELSAYLASFAWSPTPYTTFFQACDATDGQGGPHAHAMSLILDGLGTSCSEVPADLSKRARGLEESLLGRTTPITFEAASK